jgi:hypothetical protein
MASRPHYILECTELKAFGFRAEFSGADPLLFVNDVVLATARKQHDEVDLLHILGERTNISLDFNELVVVFEFVELVGHKHLRSVLNHAVAREGLDGQYFFGWVEFAVCFNFF